MSGTYHSYRFYYNKILSKIDAILSQIIKVKRISNENNIISKKVNKMTEYMLDTIQHSIGKIDTSCPDLRSSAEFTQIIETDEANSKANFATINKSSSEMPSPTVKEEFVSYQTATNELWIELNKRFEVSYTEEDLVIITDNIKVLVNSVFHDKLTISSKIWYEELDRLMYDFGNVINSNNEICYNTKIDKNSNNKFQLNYEYYYYHTSLRLKKDIQVNTNHMLGSKLCYAYELSYTHCPIPELINFRYSYYKSLYPKPKKRIYKLYNGAYYYGELKSNKFDGYGIYIWPDGKVYEGRFKNNMLDGHGVTLYRDESKYVGGHQENHRHGYGYIESKDGLKVKVNYKNGVNLK